MIQKIWTSFFVVVFSLIFPLSAYATTRYFPSYGLKSDIRILREEISKDMLKQYNWALENRGQTLGLIYVPKDIYMAQPSAGIEKYVMDTDKSIDIHWKQAWETYQKSDVKREVIIALIDTGVDIYHEDLYTHMYTNPLEIPDDGDDNDANHYIDDVRGWNFYTNSAYVYEDERADAHGTHNAGIMARLTDAEHIKIMPLKVLGADGRGSSIREAIAYAANNGAKICNLSITSEDFDEELYLTMKNTDMLFVVSVGNGDATSTGFDIDIKSIYPASYDLDHMITVVNVDSMGNLQRSSNYGKESADIAAPGTFIISTLPGDAYGIKSGTSMAAPFVSAAAALLYSYHTDKNLMEIKEAILTSARKLPALEGKTKSGGMLDIYAALQFGR